jgi:hypothetical protein
LYRPQKNVWEDGFARNHQSCLSNKNISSRTQGNFIPMIKVLKHIRSLFNRHDCSFHIECLLYSLSDEVFCGAPADYITSVLEAIAAKSSPDWYGTRCMTPCGDRDIFTPSEWAPADWIGFHELISKCAKVARAATATGSYADAITAWQAVLGDVFFPATVS